MGSGAAPRCWGKMELGVVALVLLVRPRVAAQRCATYVGSLWYALRSTASFSGAEATHNYRESMGGLPTKRGSAKKKRGRPTSS